MQQKTLPTHPSKRHPLTGEPLEALYVRDDGRIFWPVIGGAPEGGDGGGQGGDGGQGGTDGDGGGSGGQGGSGGTSNATDDQGRDLGFPKDTRVAEMKPDEQAAYWKHQSQKHEGRYKNLTGDRSYDDVKADLDRLAEIDKAQQTPAEQALTAAREEGKTEGINGERRNTAATVFRAQLEAGGVTGDDLDELVANFNVDSYITDNGVDTTKIATFAKRFLPSDTDKRIRDFGGGDRRGGGSGGSGGQGFGAAGRAEAERRGFKKTTTGAE